MKKILIFSLAYFPKHVGGAEVAIKEITDRISPKEIEFDMVTCLFDSSQKREEKIGNVNVYRIGIGNKIDKIIFPVLGTIKVFKLNKINKYDYFWAMMVTFSSGAAYIFNMIQGLFGRKKTPVILTLQEGDSEEHFRSKYFGMINVSWKLALKRTSYVTAISQFLERRAREFGYEGESSLIPNAVDFNKFSARNPQEEKKIIEKLEKQRGDVFLITTSRLVKKNACEDVIESLTFLPENIKFLIIGNGPEENKLKKKVQNLGLEKRVRFFGYIPHSEMIHYLHVADIFVRPALSEGFGNSYIEAMAAGIPVIATPVGGIMDFLRDGETGLFCEIKNPKSIAQKVEKIMKDKESRDYIVNNARNMVKEKYDWNLIANEMKNKVFLRVI